jgi:hypothetical protein
MSFAIALTDEQWEAALALEQGLGRRDDEADGGYLAWRAAA